MATRQPFGTAYGLSDALLDVFPRPYVSTRNPTTADKAQLGTLWINKATDDGFVLTSIVANSATWIGIGGGAGTFTSITVNPGNITATAGDIIATAGDIVATAGAVSAGTTVTAGTDIVATNNITATNGNIVASTGEINATAGGLTVATDITTTTGNVVVTLGNISVAAGNITATVGDITAVGGNIVAAAGVVNGAQVEATGDLGGVVSVTSLTNVVDNTQGAGTLSILSSSANPGNNAGFLKIYVGATTAYVPYFTNIAP